MSTRSQGHAERDRQRVDFEAAEWAVLHDRGLSAREQDEFLLWLARNPRHGEAFKRQQETWQQLDALAQWRPEHSVQPNPGLLEQRQTKPLQFRAWLIAGIAAALAVAAGAGFWSERQQAPRAPQVSPAIAQAYERRVLNDGSVVQMNRGAAFETHFTPQERHVALLHGEAYFMVAKNPRRPFIVRARGVDVRAVGTAFNVRLTRDAVDVIVTEGRVTVRGGGAAGESREISVGAGERTTMAFRGAAPARVEKISAAAVAQALAWQPQILDFASAPLGEVVREFNRRNRVQLVIADPTLDRLPIVATFRSDNVDGFVRLLEASAGVRAERGEGEIRLLRAP